MLVPAVRRILVVVVLGAILGVSAAAEEAAASRNGVLLGMRPFAAPVESYDAFVELALARRSAGEDAPPDRSLFERRYRREDFERLVNRDGVECYRVIYSSDGLEIVGYLLKPSNTSGRRLPAIVYNRGGNRDFGSLNIANFVELARLASEGFVVLASSYRGGSGSEGKDEYGGADVRDVLNLVTVAQSLEYVDSSNIFMLGESRGGMMTYLAVKHGAPVKAIAVVGAISDLGGAIRERPPMRKLAKELIPDFESRERELVRERSALEWPEAITAPALILHGGEDWRVSPRESIELAGRLLALGRSFELVIYAGDDHNLSRNPEDRHARIVAWFRRHLTAGT